MLGVSEEDIGHAIIGAAIKVHPIVGPGLLEGAYKTCLLYKLKKQVYWYGGRF
jgi:GxxExxY protein